MKRDHQSDGGVADDGYRGNSNSGDYVGYDVRYGSDGIGGEDVTGNKIGNDRIFNRSDGRRGRTRRGGRGRNRVGRSGGKSSRTSSGKSSGSSSGTSSGTSSGSSSGSSSGTSSGSSSGTSSRTSSRTSSETSSGSSSETSSGSSSGRSGGMSGGMGSKMSSKSRTITENTTRPPIGEISVPWTTRTKPLIDAQIGTKVALSVTTPVLLLTALLLVLLCIFRWKFHIRFQKPRRSANRSDKEGYTMKEPQEVVKGKVNNKGQREAPLNFYTDADKELANSSESNKIPTKATTAGAYEDVDEKVTKLPLSRNTTSGEVDGPEYEEVPENKTPFYHTLELESTSNGAVMSHQNDDYDQLARGDPSKKADIETTSRADYNTLNVKPESNSYDTLKRGGNSRPDVIDGNEYSHLSKPIASVSSSYDILNRQAKISDANTNTQ